MNMGMLRNEGEPFDAEFLDLKGEKLALEITIYIGITTLLWSFFPFLFRIGAIVKGTGSSIIKQQ